MSAHSADTLRFLKLLVRKGSETERTDTEVRVSAGSASARIPLDVFEKLASAGLVEMSFATIVARPEARTFIRRHLAENDTAFLHQHGQICETPGGTLRNVSESPISRLAGQSKGKSPFLLPHHLEAAVRFQHVFAKARLAQRTTLSYDLLKVDESICGREMKQRLSGTAIDARRQLARLSKLLPRDSFLALTDICGFEKGLQLVETEQRWPRRSAKLVLRIALEQVAKYYRLEPVAEGHKHGRTAAWKEASARPDVVG